MTENPADKISTTHDVEFNGDRVVKTFRTWERGEHLREWRGLTLLRRFAPGLGPDPISAELDAQPPRIVMSRVPGEPLGTRRATPEQVDALVTALERMHRCVPDSVLATADPQDTPADVAELLKKMLASRARPTHAAAPVVRRAFDAASELIGSDWATRAASIGEPSTIFGLCDGNLANYLWDGQAVHVIDFESAGSNDRAFDIADLVEHISLRRGSEIVADDLLKRLDLRADEHERVRAYRPAFAVFWLLMLLPDGPAHRHNPPGALEDQAEHLLAIL
ncbi:aminoglycoside phosphotransferase family protein [Streptomyces sp. G-G2]|uniref:aminoglycoside phosphotransferase family protein n=1 Tax=Streptomyces sp. G-G2 TaxID=3046201 RepID=UPI0024BA16A1|nr:aminoglycoside phosphotransferase family protein [Streptomyces sp. G-G2]MDJ0386330.1 aminoglycoside phosphotransferase family protein [Streptomyces sp. G-G2]